MISLKQIEIWVEQSLSKDEYWKAYLWDLKTGMKELGTLGGNESYAWSLNDAGVVVGKSQIPEGGTHGFIWIDGEMFDINNYILITITTL